METADGTYEAELLGFEAPSTVCVGVAEGKHRMVRRMLANAGASWVWFVGVCCVLCVVCGGRRRPTPWLDGLAWAYLRTLCLQTQATAC